MIDRENQDQKRVQAMTSPALTPEVAHAAGWDAGNRSMRAAGRTRWNEEDWDAAATETNRLMSYILPEHIVDRMREDGQL